MTTAKASLGHKSQPSGKTFRRINCPLPFLPKPGAKSGAIADNGDSRPNGTACFKNDSNLVSLIDKLWINVRIFI